MYDQCGCAAPGASSDTVVPPATVANDEIDVGTSMPVVTAPAPVVEQPSSPVREGVHVVEPLQPCFLCLDGRPRLPYQRYRGEERKTRHHHIRLTVSRRNALGVFRTKTVCLMYHHSHQDSSFGNLEGVSRLRLRGYYCRRRWMTLMIRFWVFRSHMQGVKIFRGQSPQCPCLYMCGRLVRPSCWILQCFRLCWLRGPPLCRRRGPRPLLHRFGGRPVIRDRTVGLSVSIFGVRRPAISDENPAYGLQIHHPRFLEFIGAPESARLLDCSPTFWVDQLGKEQAMVAAINLQRDAGVMLSNLQILSQFVTALHRMSFSMMALGIGQSLFPGAEVDDLSPAPRAARAASYMSAMGLWHPQTGPGDPRPVPVSSCHSCMNCKYCFSEDQLPPG